MTEGNIQKEEQNNKPFDLAQGKLKELELTCEEYLNKWKRAEADFINYKKGEIERTGLMVGYAREGIILKILPILDTIYFARKIMPEELKDNEWVDGLLQIQKQIEDLLIGEGMETIEAEGKLFNPETMEALEEIKIEDKASGIVVEELQKGYKMGNKIIRPAKVKVTK